MVRSRTKRKSNTGFDLTLHHQFFANRALEYVK
jgi:hypothetical protein